MADHEHRSVSRDSLFLLADMRVTGGEGMRRVKVRNLSAQGMMAEGAGADALRGTLVEVNIRNIGWVSGAVAWVQGNRCGIAFSDAVDPLAARAPVTVGEGTPRYVKPALPAGSAGQRLRKV
ncbi:MAG: PilZ domain-containing protein [Novosphingobium sp.]